MTFTELASAMRRLADAVEKSVAESGKDADNGKPEPMLSEDAAVGGAAILCYIRDLITVADRDQWDRGSLLVLLETISRDAEIFPCGIGQLVWNAEEEDDEDRS